MILMFYDTWGVIVSIKDKCDVGVLGRMSLGGAVSHTNSNFTAP
jgi:hypothetical protein